MTYRREISERLAQAAADSQAVSSEWQGRCPSEVWEAEIDYKILAGGRAGEATCKKLTH